MPVDPSKILLHIQKVYGKLGPWAAIWPKLINTSKAYRLGGSFDGPALIPAFPGIPGNECKLLRLGCKVREGFVKVGW